MSDVGGVSPKRHFSNEEEEVLRRDESTNTVLRRDTKSSADIRGLDRSWPSTKEHQQSHVGVAGGVELGHAIVEGGELAEAYCLGAAGAIGGSALTLGLGIHGLLEAHAKGDEQARALERDAVHVALIGTLDLPETYKNARLSGDYKHVSTGFHSPTFQYMEALHRDPKGRAVVQLHADRGMNAARDMSRAGMSAEAFLKTNPKVADSYSRDAAFREGFDAYLHTRAHAPRKEVEALEKKLDERDGWYAQSNVSFRV